MELDAKLLLDLQIPHRVMICSTIFSSTMPLAAQTAKLGLPRASHVQKLEGESFQNSSPQCHAHQMVQRGDLQGLLRLKTVPFQDKTPPEEALHTRNGSDVAWEDHLSYDRENAQWSAPAVVDDLLGRLVHAHGAFGSESMPKMTSVLLHKGLMSADLAVVDDLLGRCVLALWEFELREAL